MHHNLNILLYFDWAFQLFLLSFLVQPMLLLIIYLLRKLFPVPAIQPQKTNSHKQYQFGIVITAHRETIFIPPIIDSLLRQTYSLFHVYVVADDCDISGLNFDDPRILLLKPPIPLNTNSKSIDYAVEHFKDDDSVIVILDPDNLVHPQFLEVLNNWYNKGMKAVQGNLLSKNSGNRYEIMDNCGALFNNFIDRDMRSLLGLSTNICGSGISVDKVIYQKIIYDNRSLQGGFDKHMQLDIVKNVPRIAYARDAILFEEKISDSKSMENQRIRWINSYFKFLLGSVSLFLTGIKKMDFNISFFGYNLIRPPYFLLVLLAALFIGLDFSMHSPQMAGAWLLALLLFILSFIGIIILHASDKRTQKGIFYMPLFLYHQVRSLLRLK
jgi:cellulose synthase/poly-beta-1,6-N-acetylglucosamine synthase-like glycosyltransferase